MKNIKLNVIIKSFFSLLLITYLVFIMDWKMISTLDLSLTIPLIFSVLVVLFFLGFMTLRWKILIDLFKRGTLETKYINIYTLYLVGMFFNVFLLGAIGGDVARTNYSNKKYDLGLKKSASIVFGERICGLMALSIIFSVAFLANKNIQNIINLDKWIAVSIVTTMVFIVPIAFKRIVKNKLKMQYKLILLLIVLSGLGQLADITIAYIFVYFFELNITCLDLLFIMPLVYIATILPVSFGGLGVRESSMVGLFALLGADKSIAIIISFLMYLVKVLVGMIGWFFYMKMNSEIKELAASEG
ncbi:MAG: flippase-like domain-containing protein [Candidatus Brocadiaceae bacterium]|nr:flippase-like domain-containing protein [Candidatus Brocadiaceae bacterium]